MIRAELSGHYRSDARYPAAMVNVTNRCNLACRHCFVFRDANPNETPESIRDELGDAEMLETLAALRDRHGIVSMLWMGGEPLLKPRLLAEGIRLFPRNTITTNGTAPLIDFGPGVLYVVSLDGPEDLNDAIRGEGVFRRVLRNLARAARGLLLAGAGAVRRHAAQPEPRLEELVAGAARDARRLDDLLVLRPARGRRGPRRLGDQRGARRGRSRGAAPQGEVPGLHPQHDPQPRADAAARTPSA